MKLQTALIIIIFSSPAELMGVSPIIKLLLQILFSI